MEILYIALSSFMFEIIHNKTFFNQQNMNNKTETILVRNTLQYFYMFLFKDTVKVQSKFINIHPYVNE